MKFDSIAFMLFALTSSARATGSNLRELSSKTPEANLLAQIDIGPDAHVRLLELNGNVVIEAEGEGDKNKDILMKAIFKAKNYDNDMDLMVFFKNLAGADDVPTEVVVASNIMGNKKLNLKNETDPEDPPAPPASSKAFEIDDDDTNVKHGDDENGDRRLSSFCSTLPPSCACHTYLTGDHYSNYHQYYVESFLQPHFAGQVMHTIYMWNGHSWSRIISKSAHSEKWSYIEALSGSYEYWRVQTTNGDGDSYDWAYC